MSDRPRPPPPLSPNENIAETDAQPNDQLIPPPAPRLTPRRPNIQRPLSVSDLRRLRDNLQSIPSAPRPGSVIDAIWSDTQPTGNDLIPPPTPRPHPIHPNDIPTFARVRHHHRSTERPVHPPQAINNDQEPPPPRRFRSFFDRSSDPETRRARHAEWERISAGLHPPPRWQPLEAPLDWREEPRPRGFVRAFAPPDFTRIIDLIATRDTQRHRPSIPGPVILTVHSGRAISRVLMAAEVSIDMQAQFWTSFQRILDTRNIGRQFVADINEIVERLGLSFEGEMQLWQVIGEVDEEGYESG